MPCSHIFCPSPLCACCWQEISTVDREGLDAGDKPLLCRISVSVKVSSLSPLRYTLEFQSLPPPLLWLELINSSRRLNRAAAEWGNRTGLGSAFLPISLWRARRDHQLILNGFSVRGWLTEQAEAKEEIFWLKYQ